MVNNKRRHAYGRLKEDAGVCAFAKDKIILFLSFFCADISSIQLLLITCYVLSTRVIVINIYLVTIKIKYTLAIFPPLTEKMEGFVVNSKYNTLLTLL